MSVLGRLFGRNGRDDRDESHARTDASIANADAALAEAHEVNGMVKRRLIEDARRADEALRSAYQAKR